MHEAPCTRPPPPSSIFNLHTHLTLFHAHGTHCWLPIPLIMPVSFNDHTRCSTFTSPPSLTAPPIPFLSLSLHLPTPSKLIFLLIMETHPYTSLRTFCMRYTQNGAPWCSFAKIPHFAKTSLMALMECVFSMGSLQLPLPMALIRRVRRMPPATR